MAAKTTPKKRNDIAWSLDSMPGEIWSPEVADAVVDGDTKDWIVSFPSLVEIASWDAMDFHLLAFHCLMAYRHMMPPTQANATTITIQGAGRAISIRVPLPQPPFVTLAIRLYDTTSTIVFDDAAAPARADFGYMVGLIRLSLYDDSMQRGIAEKDRIVASRNSNKENAFKDDKESILRAIKTESQRHAKQTNAMMAAAKELKTNKTTLYAYIKKNGFKDEVDMIFEQSIPD